MFLKLGCSFVESSFVYGTEAYKFESCRVYWFLQQFFVATGSFGTFAPSGRKQGNFPLAGDSWIGMRGESCCRFRRDRPISQGLAAFDPTFLSVKPSIAVAEFGVVNYDGKPWLVSPKWMSVDRCPGRLRKDLTNHYRNNQKNVHNNRVHSSGLRCFLASSRVSLELQ